MKKSITILSLVLVMFMSSVLFYAGSKVEVKIMEPKVTPKFNENIKFKYVDELLNGKSNLRMMVYIDGVFKPIYQQIYPKWPTRVIYFWKASRGGQQTMHVDIYTQNNKKLKRTTFKFFVKPKPLAGNIQIGPKPGDMKALPVPKNLGEKKPMPDLISEFRAVPTGDVYAGEYATFIISIKNIGDKTTGVPVTYMLEEGKVSGTIMCMEHSITKLDPGVSVTKKCAVFPNKHGAVKYYLTADYFGKVAESNEYNNITNVTVNIKPARKKSGLPQLPQGPQLVEQRPGGEVLYLQTDFSMNSVNISPSPYYVKDTITFNATISKVGANQVKLPPAILTINGTNVASTTLTPVLATTPTYMAEFKFTPTQIGVIEWEVIVDPDNSVSESNKLNNKKKGSLKIQER